MRKCALLLCVVLVLGACTIGPDYRRPKVQVPDKWRLGTTEVSEISGVAWWDQFQDPALSNLVRVALEHNKDLQFATANVDQALAQYGITRAALFPRVDANASAQRERLSQNTAPFRVPSGAQVANDFALNLSASYEIDIWGKLRRATEAARASLLATEEGRRTVVLTVVSSVANAYIGLRALDEKLDIARRTLDNRREVLRLQKVRFDEGAAPESDYRQAESQYQTAAAEVPELERQIARQENLISVLLGGNPGAIERGHSLDALLFPKVPAGLPASLLERRPDILQAEQNLVAANADIGVAKAAFFPDISLTALLGLESTELSDLFNGPSRAWSFGGGVTQPIFNAAQIRNQLAQAEALRRQALYAYQRSIISGFQEVENALIDRARLTTSRDEQAKKVAALRRFRDLAQLRYKEGATIYLEVANAEDLLFNAELALTDTRAQLFQSYADLYKAIGGGWVADAEKIADTAPSDVH
jgi:multidrug efflux system outer membrane protein